MSRYGVHMDQLITPAIRCNGNADEAAQFYADVFRAVSYTHLTLPTIYSV